MASEWQMAQYPDYRSPPLLPPVIRAPELKASSEEVTSLNNSQSFWIVSKTEQWTLVWQVEKAADPPSQSSDVFIR